jgi:hypothetical protein
MMRAANYNYSTDSARWKKDVYQETYKLFLYKSNRENGKEAEM